MFHFISVSPLFNLCFTSTIISSTFVSPLIPSSYLHYPFLLHLSFISVSSASPLIITSHLCFHFYLRHTLITLCCHLYLRKPHPRSTCVSPVSHLPPPPARYQPWTPICLPTWTRTSSISCKGKGRPPGTSQYTRVRGSCPLWG